MDVNLKNISDSHAHLTDSLDINLIDKQILEANNIGVSHIINIATSNRSLNLAIDLFDKYRNFFSATATPPHDANKADLISPERIKELFLEKKIIALGETGLDYFYYKDYKKEQIDLFESYLSLSEALSIPVIIHCRDAFNDLFSIIKNFNVTPLLHCFTGNKEDLKKLLDNNFSISFSGIVTFKNSSSLRELINYVPNNKILLETDSPYLAPQSKRGQKNEPKNIIEIFKLIADIKKIDTQDLCNICLNNLKNFIKI